MTKRSPFRYFRTSPEIIRLAVMMYVRFPLSLRNVEDLLHERGIEISHETVRFWWQRFGPMFASEIRRKRVSGMRGSRWRWHLDEVFVKVNGVQHYLWRAVDHEGEVLEAFVSKTRDKAAALKFLRKLMKSTASPRSWSPMGSSPTEPLSRRSGPRTGRSPGGGRTTGWETHTSHFDGASEPCSASDACEVSKSSPPSTHQYRTTSTRIGASQAAASTRPHGPPLLPSGGSFARPEAGRICPNRDWFASV